MCLDQDNQLLDRSRRDGWVDREHQSGGNRERDRIEVLFEFIRDSVVERGIDHVAGIDHQQGVAVGYRFGRAAHTVIAAAAAHVLNEKLLSQMLCQFLRQQARDHVGRTAGRVGNDHAHRAIGVCLRPREPRRRMHGHRSRCQV